MRIHGRSRFGFTLTELVIAVGVIALLVGILLPTVSRARETARIVQCTNNLRQISTSFRVWGQNQGMRLPSGSGWTGAVTNAAKTDSVLWCPDGPNATGPSDFGTGPTIDYLPNQNHGHPTSVAKINDDHFTVTTTYQKNKPEYATFDFVRISGNLWKMTPTHIDGHKPYGGPPIDVYGSDGTVFYNVQANQKYNVYIGSAGTGGSTYGYNVQMAALITPKTGRVLATDNDTSTLSFDASGTLTTTLPLRHQKTKANVLFTDGSVVLTETKELQSNSKLFDPKP